MKKGQKMAEAEKAKRQEAARRQWTPEKRAEQSERIRAAKARASASEPSSGSTPSSVVVPPPLSPAPAASQSSGEALLEKLLSRLTTETTPKAEKTSPTLPDGDAEREAALRPARWPARTAVVGFNETFRVLGMDELSAEERDEGVNAFAVLFYQWGLFRDGRVLVSLWLFGTLVPRGTTAFLRWKAAKALTS